MDRVFRMSVLCLMLAATLSGRAENAAPLKISPDRQVKLKIVKLAPVYGTQSLQGHVKNFVPDEPVLLLTYTPTALLVKSLASDYSGWVSIDSVSAIDPDLISSLKAEAEEEKLFAEAIKDEKVLPGMTFTHVKESLGKATSETFRTDENGRFDTWSYVDYEYRYERRQVFDPHTRISSWQSYRVKVPVGSLNVEFKNGRVAAIERTKDPNATLKR